MIDGIDVFPLRNGTDVVPHTIQVRWVEVDGAVKPERPPAQLPQHPGRSVLMKPAAAPERTGRYSTPRLMTLRSGGSRRTKWATLSVDAEPAPRVAADRPGQPRQRRRPGLRPHRVPTSDGSQAAVAVPEQVVPAVRRMREAFYQPDDGTWFSMRYMLDPPGSIQKLFNRDCDPHSSPVIDPAGWVPDLDAYPRDAARIQPWLRAGWPKPAARCPGTSRSSGPGRRWLPNAGLALAAIGNIDAIPCRRTWSQVLSPTARSAGTSSCR